MSLNERNAFAFSCDFGRQAALAMSPLSSIDSSSPLAAQAGYSAPSNNPEFHRRDQLWQADLIYIAVFGLLVYAKLHGPVILRIWRRPRTATRSSGPRDRAP